MAVLKDVAVAKAIKSKGWKRYELTTQAQSSKNNAGKAMCMVLGIGDPKSFAEADIDAVEDVYDEIDVAPAASATSR